MSPEKHDHQQSGKARALGYQFPPGINQSVMIGQDSLKNCGKIDGEPYGAKMVVDLNIDWQAEFSTRLHCGLQPD